MFLQISREPLKAGCEVEYQNIEEETARLAAALGCPHPYLAAESLSGPKEVWWFNSFRDLAERRQVVGAYAKNPPLMQALRRNSERKAPLTGPVRQGLVHPQPDLSIGPPWAPGIGRFLLIAETNTNADMQGTVFASSDGLLVIVTAFRTRDDAEAARLLTRDAATLFAVRPSWSFPAREWVADDPEFWPAGPGVTLEP